MQRSMIQQLTGSNIFMNRSFITTATQNYSSSNQPYDLKKSRIYNLPNYKKQDLSGKQSFVVVFQAIEIQRLSIEIQTLRVKLKDAQRHIFNSSNYQVQIRQLTEKCISYERQRQQYRQQIEKMNTICQRLYDELEEMKIRYSQVDLTLKEKYKLQKVRNDQLYQEVQKWKRKFASLQTSKNKQIQDIKLMVQSQRKSMIDRQIRQLTVKFEAERNGLQNQIRKLRGSLQNKNNQIFRAQSEMTRMEITIKQLERNQQQLNQYENKVVMLSQQMMRLNQLLKSRQQQIDRLRANQNRLRSTITETEKSTQNYKQLILRQKQMRTHIEKISTQYSRLQQQNRRSNIQAQKVSEYERLLDNSANQIERLNQIVRDKIHEVQKWQKQYTSIEIHCQQLKNHQQKLPQLQNRVSALIGQNQRIDSILKSRTKEVQQWKGKNQNLQRNIQNYRIIQKERSKLQNQMRTKERVIEQKVLIINRMQNQLQKMNQLENMIGQYDNKSRQLSKEVDRLNILVRNKSKQCEDLSQILNSKDKELYNLRDMQNQLNEYRRQQAFFTQQLDRINNLVSQKSQQIQHLKEHFLKISHHIEDYQKVQMKLIQNTKQMEQLLTQLDQSRRESQFHQDRAIKADAEIQRLHNEIFSANRQKESFVYILQQKDRQMQQFVIELRQRDQQVKSLREVQLRYSKLQAQYSEVQSILRSEAIRFQNISKQMQRLKNEGVYSRQFLIDFMNFKKQVEQNNVEYQNMLFRLQNIQNILRALRVACEKQMKMERANQEKWQSTNNIVNSLNQFMKRTVSIHNQMAKLSQQNILLQSSTRLLNFQVQNQNNLMSKSLIVSQFETPHRFGNQNELHQDSYKRRMNIEATRRYQF